jgi:SPP1 family phage portal protein
MELAELTRLLSEPTKLVTKFEELDNTADLPKWEPEGHPVTDEDNRPKRKVDVPTGILDNDGEMIYRTEYEEVNRIPSSTNKEIVDWSVRMSLGVPVELEADTKTPAQETMLAMLQKTISANKMDFLDQEIERQRLIHLNVLEVWYSEPAPEGYWDGIVSGVKFRWKIMIMSPEYGDIIVPAFNSYRELVAVARFFTILDDEGKEIKSMELYTEDGRYTFTTEAGGWKKSGFKANHKDIGKKLMCVLWQANRRETADVQAKLDRREVIDSDNADENAASGRPILAIWGDIQAVAKRGNTGKTFQLTGGSPNEKPDMKYVERTGAAAAIETERKNLLTDIYNDTATPNPAMFNELASGNAPGINIKLRFTPTINKAKSRQQGELGLGHQRRINILKSAVYVINKSIKSALSLEVKPKFGIDLPENTTEKYDNIVKLVTAGLMSKETAIAQLAFTDDPAAEFDKIKAEAKEAADLVPKSQPTI